MFACAKFLFCLYLRIPYTSSFTHFATRGTERQSQMKVLAKIHNILNIAVILNPCCLSFSVNLTHQEEIFLVCLVSSSQVSLFILASSKCQKVSSLKVVRTMKCHNSSLFLSFPSDPVFFAHTDCLECSKCSINGGYYYFLGSGAPP